MILSNEIEILLYECQLILSGVCDLAASRISMMCMIIVNIIAAGWSHVYTAISILDIANIIVAGWSFVIHCNTEYHSMFHSF